MTVLKVDDPTPARGGLSIWLLMPREVIETLLGPFGRPMPEALADADSYYDDDLDAWRSPDDEPIGGVLGDNRFMNPFAEDAGDECTCPACQGERAVRDLIEIRARETPFQRVLRVADEGDYYPGPAKAHRYSTADLSGQGYTQAADNPNRWERPFSTHERLAVKDAWSGARQLERKQAQEAQARAAFEAEKQERAFRDSAARFAANERDARRRNGGILVLWTDTPGKGVPLYSISHWGAH